MARRGPWEPWKEVRWYTPQCLYHITLFSTNTFFIFYFNKMVSVFKCVEFYRVILFLVFWFQVGFEMVDAIAEAEGISISTVSFKALLGKGTYAYYLNPPS